MPDGNTDQIEKILELQAKLGIQGGQVAGQPYPRWKVYDAPVISGSIDEGSAVHLEIGVGGDQTMLVTCRNESEPWWKFSRALLRHYRKDLSPLILTVSGDLTKVPLTIDRVTIIGQRQSGGSDSSWDWTENGKVRYRNGLVTLESGEKVKCQEPFFPQEIRSALNGGKMILTMERQDSGRDQVVMVTADARSIAAD